HPKQGKRAGFSDRIHPPHCTPPQRRIKYCLTVFQSRSRFLGGFAVRIFWGRKIIRRLVAVAGSVAFGLAAGDLTGAVRVSPGVVSLDRPEASQQLLITETLPDGRSRDATRTTTYQVSIPAVASVDSTGLVRPLADGK